MAQTDVYTVFKEGNLFLRFPDKGICVAVNFPEVFSSNVTKESLSEAFPEFKERIMKSEQKTVMYSEL